jgi:hypothetical protein
MAQIPEYMLNINITDDFKNTTTLDHSMSFFSIVIIISSSILSGIAILIIGLIILFCKYKPHRIMRNKMARYRNRNNIYNKGIFYNSTNIFV